MDSEEQARKLEREKAGEIGRKAARLFKNAVPATRRFVNENRPRVEKAIDDTRPRVEKAIQDTRPRVEKAIQDTRPRVEKAIQDARPQVEKAVEEYRPRVEQAGREAVHYAQEHQDEIRGLALRGARMRMGPLGGMALDAMGLGPRSAGTRPHQPQAACPHCQSPVPTAAKFCGQCGTALTPPG